MITSSVPECFKTNDIGSNKVALMIFGRVQLGTAYS